MTGNIGIFWRKIVRRGFGFLGASKQMRMIYTVEDPWNMASEREQDRFSETNAKIMEEVGAHFDTIMELGCGEGHQTIHLLELADRAYSLDISEAAVERARRRCPEVKFEATSVEESYKLFPDIHFDLITACEVLYYVNNLDDVLPLLQTRTRHIFVTMFRPLADKMRHHLTGKGWRRLDDMTTADKREFECFLWTEDPAETMQQN